MSKAGEVKHNHNRDVAGVNSNKEVMMVILSAVSALCCALKP